MYTTLIDAEVLFRHFRDPDWVIVDCRFSLGDAGSGRRAYLDSHIPGAVYAHLEEDLSGPVIQGKTGRHPLPTVDRLRRLFSAWGIGSGVQVVAYDDMSGAIAARLWWMLRWLSHDAVAVLDGGWPAWLEAGYPVDSEKPEPVWRSFEATQRPEMLAGAGFVEDIRLSRDYRLIDSRSPERYRGEQEPIDPVAGHIEGAVNAPHQETVRADGRWLDPRELRQRFEKILDGVEPEHAVFYCGSGVTACRNLLALSHSGLGEGKLYAGSWSEWIARLPQ